MAIVVLGDPATRTSMLAYYLESALPLRLTLRLSEELVDPLSDQCRHRHAPLRGEPPQRLRLLLIELNLGSDHAIMITATCSHDNTQLRSGSRRVSPDCSVSNRHPGQQAHRPQPHQVEGRLARRPQNQPLELLERLHPEALAQALTKFFKPAQQPA